MIQSRPLCRLHWCSDPSSWSLLEISDDDQFHFETLKAITHKHNKTRNNRLSSPIQQQNIAYLKSISKPGPVNHCKSRQWVQAEPQESWPGQMCWVVFQLHLQAAALTLLLSWCAVSVSYSVFSLHVTIVISLSSLLFVFHLHFFFEPHNMSP